MINAHPLISLPFLLPLASPSMHCVRRSEVLLFKSGEPVHDSCLPEEGGAGHGQIMVVKKGLSTATEAGEGNSFFS